MVTLASISYIFRVFIKGAITFIRGAVTFIGGAVTFVGKESSAIGERLFKIAKARVVNDIKEVDRRVNRRNLRR